MESNEVVSKLSESKEAIHHLADTAKNRLTNLSTKLVEGSKHAASNTDAYVREYAWSSVALAALAGIVVGLIIRRS